MGAFEHNKVGLLASVDARSRLAGTNRLESLLFRLGKNRATGKEEVFGINVFKVREVMQRPEITASPGSPPAVVGMVSLRGELLPVIDTSKAIGLDVESDRKVMVVTEFNQRLTAFLVDGVETIVRMDWSEVTEPPEMLRAGNVAVTAVSKLSDGRLLQVLDLEHLLHVTGGDSLEDVDCNLEGYAVEDLRVVVVDDSSFARKQLCGVLDRLGVRYETATNGANGLHLLEAKARAASNTGVPVSSLVDVVISDIEMPEMDGFTLVKALRSDPRFEGVKLFLHSSISGSSNERLSVEVGADGFLPKFNAESIAAALAGVRKAPRDNAAE